MKGIIIYQGKYGATKQYAAWLSNELNLPAVSAANIQGSQLKDFDYLLIGSSVYVGKLKIRNWLKEHAGQLEGKKIFFFQVAAAPAADLEKRMVYNSSSIPVRLIPFCQFYFLEGKMIMKHLSRFDRFMLKMGARLTRDPEAKKHMLTDFDRVKKENLDGLLRAVRAYLKPSSAHEKLVPA